MRSRPLSRQRKPSKLPARPIRPAASGALGEITLWTTRDGREIPLDEMSDEHVRNAIAALSRWRARLRKRPDQEHLKQPLGDAIARFRRILRQRIKSSGAASPRLSRL